MIIKDKLLFQVVLTLFLVQLLKLYVAEADSFSYEVEPPIIVPGSKPMEKFVYLEENNIHYQCVQKCYPVLKPKSIHILRPKSSLSNSIKNATTKHSPPSIRILPKNMFQIPSTTFCQYVCSRCPFSTQCTRCRPHVIPKDTNIIKVPEIPSILDDSQQKLRTVSFCSLICRNNIFSIECVRCRSYTPILSLTAKKPYISVVQKALPILHDKIKPIDFLTPSSSFVKIKKRKNRIFTMYPIVSTQSYNFLTRPANLYSKLYNISNIPAIKIIKAPNVVHPLIPNPTKHLAALLNRPMVDNSLIINPRPYIIYNSMRCCYLDRCMILAIKSTCPSVCYEPCDAICTNKCFMNPICPNKCAKIKINLRQYKAQFLLWLHFKLNQIKSKHRQMVQACILRTRARYLSEIKQLQAHLKAAHPYLFSEKFQIQDSGVYRRAHGISINILGQQNIGSSSGSTDNSSTSDKQQLGQYHVSQNIGINNQDSGGFENGSSESIETTTRIV